jgi:Calcineurin-like phosphoesterase
MNRRTLLKGVVAACAACAAGELFIPFVEAVSVPSFNFVHITDLHLDVRGASNWQYREKSVPLFINALRQLSRLPRLNFVVFGGDQIHYGPNDKESLDVFQQWTDHLNMPYYILLGNTEVSPVNGMSKLKREDYLNIWYGKGLRPGHSSWAFNPVSGVRVIGFDVTVDGMPYGEASRMVKNAEEVRALLKRFPNVRLAVSGHHHASRVTADHRITYVADPAIVTYPCAFRFFSVTRRGIHLKNIGLGDQTVVNRAKELLVTDSYARMYDPKDPKKVADYSVGLTAEDRETTLPM